MPLDIQNIVKQTSNIIYKRGTQVISKKLGMKINSGLAMDIVSITDKSSNMQHNIISLRDKQGQLLKRILYKKDGIKPPEYTVKQYYTDTELGFRRVISKCVKNSDVVKKIREFFSLNKTVSNKNVLFKSKLETSSLKDGETLEHQTFTEYSKGNRSNRPVLETNAIKKPNGTIRQKSVSGNIANIENIKNDPYLLKINYNKRDFLRYTIPEAKKREAVSDLKFRTYSSHLEHRTMGTSSSKGVKVDLSQNTKIDLMDTIDHEYRHQYQKNLVNKLFYINKGDLHLVRKTNCGLNKEDKALAEKLYAAQVKYHTDSSNYNSYYNNFLEVDARNAGLKGAKSFLSFCYKLSLAFPSIPIEKLCMM